MAGRSKLSFGTPALRELRRAESEDERPAWPRLTAGGPAGNDLLTALTATILLALLAVEGVTIVRLRPLISVHMFVGMLLIPPVLLKLRAPATASRATTRGASRTA